MNIEELQKSWQALDERLSNYEQKQKVEQIKNLSLRKRSNLEKLLRTEHITCAFIFICLLFFLICWYLNPFLKFQVGFVAIILICFGLISQIRICRKLHQIKNETNLEIQVIRLIKYKKAVARNLISSYLLLFVFCMTFAFFHGTIWNMLVLVFLVVCCSLVDFFIFHYLTDRVKEINLLNKELKEINDEKK